MILLPFLLSPHPTKTLPGGAIMWLEDRGPDSANNGQPGCRHSSFVWVFVGAALYLALCPPSSSFILAAAPCLWVGGPSQPPEGPDWRTIYWSNWICGGNQGKSEAVHHSGRQRCRWLVLRDVSFRYCHLIVWTRIPKGPVQFTSVQ